jgi:hypothetical protein
MVRSLDRTHCGWAGPSARTTLGEKTREPNTARNTIYDHTRRLCLLQAVAIRYTVFGLIAIPTVAAIPTVTQVSSAALCASLPHDAHRIIA